MLQYQHWDNTNANQYPITLNHAHYVNNHPAVLSNPAKYAAPQYPKYNLNLNNRPSFFQSVSPISPQPQPQQPQELPPRNEKGNGQQYTGWCNECGNLGLGHTDPSTHDFYCTYCWDAFYASVSKPTQQQSFVHQTLDELLKNEQTANQYYGQSVRVYLANNTHFRAILSSISTDNMISFDHIMYEMLPYVDHYYKPISKSFSYSTKNIIDIILLDDDSDSDKCKESRSIRDAIFDLAKLKMVEYTLHSVTKGKHFKAFDVKQRNKYLALSTNEEVKAKIGENIQAIQFPLDPNVEPIYSAFAEFRAMGWNSTDALMATWNGTIGLTDSTQWNSSDVLLAIRDYHFLWTQHIDHQNMNKSKQESVKEAKEEQKSNSNFLSWDKNEIETETRLANTPANMRKLDISAVKARTVHVPSVWPFYFFGPCQKSKKKNGDWKCMKCLGACEPHTDATGSKIVYYKSKRTDATVEICSKCVHFSASVTDHVRRSKMVRKMMNFNKMVNRWTKPQMDKMVNRIYNYPQPYVQVPAYPIMQPPYPGPMVQPCYMTMPASRAPPSYNILY